MGLHHRIVGIAVLLAIVSHGARVWAQPLGTPEAPPGPSAPPPVPAAPATPVVASTPAPSTPQEAREHAREQANREADARCAAHAAELLGDDGAAALAGEDTQGACQVVASDYVTALIGRYIVSVDSHEAPSPWRPDAVSGIGTPSQLAAAPAATPVALAGASASVVGSRVGPRVVAALSVNPAALGVLAAGDRSSLAIATRVVDVSLVLPFSLAENVGDPIDFFGVRLRANILAQVSGAAATEQTLRLRETAAAEGIVEDAFTALLRAAPDAELDRCGQAIQSLQEEAVRRHCGGGNLPREALEWADIEETLRAADARIRREADRWYLGLDIRYDYGDTRLTGDPEASDASMLLAGIAAGARVVNEPSFHLRVRCRAAFQYTHVPVADASVPDLDPISIDGGIALEAEVPISGDLFRVSVGIEGRGIVNDAPNTVQTSAGPIADTDYLDLRIGAVLPFGSGPGTGIDLSFPLIGGHGVQVAITGDLGLQP